MKLKMLEGNTLALELYFSEGFKVMKRIEGKLEGTKILLRQVLF